MNALAESNDLLREDRPAVTIWFRKDLRTRNHFFLGALVSTHLWFDLSNPRLTLLSPHCRSAFARRSRSFAVFLRVSERLAYGNASHVKKQTALGRLGCREERGRLSEPPTLASYKLSHRVFSASSTKLADSGESRFD